MVEHRVGGLPVVNAHNDLIGVVTSTDVMRAYIDLTGPAAHPQVAETAGTAGHAT